MNTNASPHTSRLLYGTRPLVAANGTDAGVVTVRLRDDQNRPVQGRTVILTADREDVVITQPAPTDEDGWAIGYVRTNVPGPVVIHGAIQPLQEPPQ
jgi:hypothetical protein